MKSKFSRVVLGNLITLNLASVCLAAEEADLNVRGFINTIAAQSSYPEIITYDKVHNKTDAVPLSTYGLVLSKAMNDQWDAAFMILARGIEDNNFMTSIEWANLAYHFNPQATIRVGKQKFPFYLNSDNAQIGVVYPWIRPPAEVYSMIPFESYHGISANYAFGDVAGGELNVEIFKAQIDGFVYGTTPYRMKARGQGAHFDYKRNFLSVRGSAYDAQVDSFVFADVLPISMTHLDSWSLGATIDLDNALVWYERASLGSDAEFFVRKVGDYLTAGYYFFDRKLLPHLTYARTLEHRASGLIGTTPIDDGKQKSMKVGLNYYFTPDIVAKLEFERTWINKGTDTLTTADDTITAVPNGRVDNGAIALSAVF